MNAPVPHYSAEERARRIFAIVGASSGNLVEWFDFSGVGSTHGFFNTGSGRVRWIETQAPQPPERHSYRWVDHWKRFDEEGL